MDISNIFKQFIAPDQLTAAAPGTAHTATNPNLVIARVVEAIDPQTVVLEIANKLLQVKTEVPLIAGQQLILRVVSSDTQMLLQVVSETNAQVTEGLQINQALRNALPQQQSLTKLVQEILQILTPHAAQQPSPHAQAVSVISQQFSQHALPAQQLTTARGVQDAVKNSGMFLEHRLALALTANPAESPSHIAQYDLKAALLRLVQQLQSSTPAARSQPENATPAAVATTPSGITQSLPLPTATTPPTLSPSPSAPASGAPVVTTPPSNSGALSPLPHNTATTPAQHEQLPNIKIVITGPENSTPASPPTLASDARGVPEADAPPPRSTVTPQVPTPAANPQAPTPALRTLIPPVEPSMAPVRTPSATVVAPNDAVTDTPPTATSMDVTAEASRAAERTPKHTAVSTEDLQFATLTKTAEGTLARQQVHQLAALDAQHQQQTMWTLEMPVSLNQQIHTLRMRIEEENTRRDHTGRAPYNVTLAMDFEPLGPLSARITLLDKQVSVVFFAERQTTLAKALEELAQLREALANNGLSVQHLQCVAGVAPTLIDPPLPLGKSILDIKA
ncbi:MAG: flagellar hook-length control protein FliK [Gammaproteobacteria bacterium]|nr:flagellar hook-length control protein FliK [Gammaproteobacteria bacterium]